MYQEKYQCCVAVGTGQDRKHAQGGSTACSLEGDELALVGVVRGDRLCLLVVPAWCVVMGSEVPSQFYEVLSVIS